VLAKLAKHWTPESEKKGKELAVAITTARVEEQKAREQAAEQRALLKAIGDELDRSGRPADAGALRTRVADVEKQVAAAKKKLEAITSIGTKALDQARARLDEATAKLALADKALATAGERTQAARSARDGAEGEARALEQAAHALPLEALRAAALEARRTFEALPRSTATEADVAAARDALDRASQILARAQQELHESRGALKEVGGTTIDERRAELDEAYKEAVERQRHLELDADAWKLLREALKESASAGVQHVGKVLADRIAPRFASLTQRRYGGIDLGPNLETVGVRTVHGNQSPDVLSVGTREQLATLLRLVIAEALQTTVILDDHLVQTDPKRLEWFIDALAEAAKKVQVIVVTCRPLDYEAARKLEGVAVSWVDLSKQIKRSAAIIQPPAAPAPVALPVDARPLPELLRASLAELAISPAELAAKLSAGPRTVESWVEGKSAPVGPFRARLAAFLGEGATPGSARSQAAERLR